MNDRQHSGNPTRRFASGPGPDRGVDADGGSYFTPAASPQEPQAAALRAPAGWTYTVQNNRALTQTLREATRRFEREYVAMVLRQHNGRVREAAEALGIQRTNLYRKARQLGLAVTKTGLGS